MFSPFWQTEEEEEDDDDEEEGGDDEEDGEEESGPLDFGLLSAAEPGELERLLTAADEALPARVLSAEMLADRNLPEASGRARGWEKGT